LKLSVVIATITTTVVIVVILGISPIINIDAQWEPQPLSLPLPLLWISEIPEDIAEGQVSQIIDNKDGKDHIESMENTSEKCNDKEEEIKELQVCSIKEGNKINSDPLGLFADIANRTR
jgi:hypothetical protein